LRKATEKLPKLGWFYEKIQQLRQMSKISRILAFIVKYKIAIQN
jgi:hypothetical protein